MSLAINSGSIDGTQSGESCDTPVPPGCARVTAGARGEFLHGHADGPFRLWRPFLTSLRW